MIKIHSPYVEQFATTFSIFFSETEEQNYIFFLLQNATLVKLLILQAAKGVCSTFLWQYLTILVKGCTV